MSLELWGLTWKIVGYIGAVLVVFSTIATSIVTDKVGALKDSKIDELITGNKTLLEDSARYKHQLDEKQEQLDNLKVKAANAALDIKRYYSFNGVCRIQNGAKVDSINGTPEQADFARLCALYNSNAWKDLVDQSSVAISKNDKWLTPYFLRALGYAEQGDLLSAKSDLDYVKSHSGESPDYAPARQMLERVNLDLSKRH
jgi:hypothetical protein